MDIKEIKKTLETRINENTARFHRIDEKLDTIMSNHLPHIQVAVTKLDERMKLCLWVLGVVGALVIGGLFVK